MKLGTQETECRVDQITEVIDASTLASVLKPGPQARVGRYEVAEVVLRTKRPVAFDLYQNLPATGRFVLVDGFEVSGGGIVLDDHYPHRTADSQHKSQNIFWSQGKVTHVQREKQNGHGAYVVWLTGLPASGKSTLATELERSLFHLGRHCYILDGDNVRHGLCKDLGFAPEDRRENIRRVGEVAKLFMQAGFIIITAFVSPYRSDRDLVRKLLPAGRFVELHVATPVEVCEQRDIKGLYAKARANEVKEFTGVSAPYEAPEKPEVLVHSQEQTPAESARQVIEYLAELDAKLRSGEHAAL